MAHGDEDSMCVATGQIVDMVHALIDAAYDKEPHVQEVICNSLCEVGKKRPNLVLSSCHGYLLKHSKLGQGHRTVTLTCMERVVKESTESLDKRQVVDIIKQASSELTASKEVVPLWQSAASGLLVAIGCRHCHEVMAELLQKFQPGILPHYMVVQTLANLAIANVYDMVPFLKVVLGTTLSVMGMAKQDNMKWIFSSAIAKFSEAIMDYAANLETAPDPSVRKEVYSQEMDAAYDILFTLWLQSKEVKLKLIVVEALGRMSYIMSRTKLDEQFPRLLPAILGLYRRNLEPYNITLGLSLLLDAMVQNGSSVVGVQLDNLLSVLFPLICQPVDYSVPMTVKNHNEVLRCFAILVVPFSDRLVNFLLQKLEPNNDKTKMAVLAILRHLINSTGPHIEDKQALIMSGLKVLLPETSNKVKKVLAQTVIAMAHHSYLEMEGGHLFIEFIVRQCALPSDPQGRRPNDPDYVSNDALRSMCDDVLLLLSTTVDNMQCVLWPYLLECVVPQCYTGAMATVCRTIAHIAGKKRQEKAHDYLVDFQHQSDIPKPPALIARLMVMAGHPLSGRRRGVHVLTAMKAMSPLMHESLVELWDTVIPKLIQYVEDGQQKEEGGEEEWTQKNWEDLLLKLLSKSVEELSDENWTCDIGRALMEQLSQSISCAKDKNFLLKCLGVVLRRATTTLFVQQCLHDAFSQVQHLSDLEREGFAIAAGFAAAAHLDSALEVIARLDAANKKSSGGLFSFIKDTKSECEERCKATVVLSYGYMSLYAPVTLIPSRLETIIQKTINPQFTSVKDACLKESLIQTVELIGRTMHPTHLRTTHNFTYRNDLLLHMQNFLKTEKPGCLSSPIRALALSACTTLIKLEPKLSDADTGKLLETALTCVLVLPPDGSGGNWLKEETYEEHVEHERLMKLTMTALADLLKHMLCKDCTPEGLEVIFKHLHEWTRSRHGHERDRAMQMCVTVFACMTDNMHLNIGTCTQFSRMGVTLARLVPRCTDPLVTVREAAIDCIQSVLQIGSKFEGPGRTEMETTTEGLPHLKEKVQHNDPSDLFSISNDIAKVLIKKVPSSELMLFLGCLLDALLDPHPHSSSGACVVINSVLKARGGELHSQVEVVLSSLHGKMGEISCRQTRTGAIRAVRTLLAHQLLTVLNLLLNYPLPFDDHISECWRVIGQDATLLAGVFTHLLELLATRLPYEELACTRDRGRTIKTATLMPIAVTCALKEIFTVEESKVEVMNCYPRLLAALLVRIASTVGTDPPKVSTEEKRQSRLSRSSTMTTVTRVVNIGPCSTSIEACKQLLQQNQSEDLLTALDREGVWSLLRDKMKYHEGFTLFARCLAETQPQYAAKLITCLCRVSSSVYQPQRVMVAAVIAELVCHRCTGDLALLDILINNLLGWLIDTSSVVRKLCIRGLGNIASLGPQVVQKYATTVLSAMMAGMDDKEDSRDEITLEAMSGLSKILDSVNETQIRAILINISLRIRPCFEKERSTIRGAAFTLFGNLSQFGDGSSKDNFFEQIHTNLISFLLHLNDPDTQVRKACKQTLRQLGPLVGSKAMNAMFQKHLLADAQLIYGEFINELTKVMIQDFESKLNFYVMNGVSFFRSSWPEIRSNAALLIGFLLGNMPKELYNLISREHVSGALILLLQDPSVEVKTRAAEAMSGLCYF